MLYAEPRAFQVGVNYGDAPDLTKTCAPEDTVRRAPDAGRYVLADTAAKGPAMFDTTRLEQPAGLYTATLGEVLCSAAVQSG